MGGESRRAFIMIRGHTHWGDLDGWPTSTASCGALPASFLMKNKVFLLCVRQVIRLRVKPLSLHQRVNELSAEEELRPRNTLRLTGSFSASLMHEWITYCLPEVPFSHHSPLPPINKPIQREERFPSTKDSPTLSYPPPSNAHLIPPPSPFKTPQVPPRIASAAEESGGGSGSITLVFRNVFTRSVLLVEYNKGSALISSDSLSTIAIFKEVTHTHRDAHRGRQRVWRMTMGTIL